MPSLNKIIADRKKEKFVKKEYRPWDLSGDTNAATNDSSALNLIKKPKESENTEFSVTKETKKNIASIEQSPKEEIKSSIEFTKDSIKDLIGIEEGSTKVQSGSNNSSQELITSSTRVQNSHLYERESGSAAIKLAIATLGGNEKKVFFFVVQLCSLKDSSTTGNMLSAEFDIELNIPRNSRETAVKRLVSKGLLIREVGKRGRHGIIALSIPEPVRIEASNYITSNTFINTIGLQTNTRQGFNQGFYNSSNNNITTTSKLDIPEDWSKINTDPLKEIGFSISQIKQLYSIGSTTPDIVQESINHFAFGLVNNPKFKKYEDPLNVFMGVLRKGQGWVEKNYRSPQVIAQQQLLERKKAEYEAIKKLEKEAFNIAFETWKETLDTSEIDKITSSKNGKNDIMPPNVKLNLYFKENIWPNKRKEYVS